MKQKKIFLTIGQLFLVGVISFQGLNSLKGFDNILNRDYSANLKSDFQISGYQNVEDVRSIFNLKKNNENENEIKIALVEESDYFYAVASWYGPGFHGRTMANGQTFNMYDENVVAHKKLPFGTRVEIINPRTNSVLEAVVKDRGPYIQGRDFDLSYAGAQKLGMVDKGVEQLKIRIIEE
jgi:rare lipoprotein A (peptidoglycan hydrolase)